MASTTKLDLTPPYVEFTVLANEPHVILIPVKDGDTPVDLATDYPQLTSRLKVGDDPTTEGLITVRDTNVAEITFPPLPRGSKIFWELRDAAADKTWVTGRINVEKDALPQ